jgi:pimeloyl-ACP methyl ester carboxylesterase
VNFEREGYVTLTDGTRLWYAVAGNPQGQGVPIVCANGIGCSIYFWKYISEYFGAHAPVLLWDYRGHGKSDIPNNKRVTVRQCAEDMRVVMNAAGITTAVHLGHSMGSQVVLEFYRLFPERTAALVPVLGSFGRPLDTFWDSQIAAKLFPFIHAAATAAPEFWGRITEQVVKPGLAHQVASTLGIINGRLAQLKDMHDYFHHISRVPVDLFFHLGKDAGEHTCEDLLPDIQCPVLIVGGENDKFTPVWLSEEMHRRVPGSELLVIREGSHAAVIEQPELINLRLEKFIRERVLPLPAHRAGGAKETPVRQARRRR